MIETLHKKEGIAVCKYCDKEFSLPKMEWQNICNKCRNKYTVLPRFAKARDDLRQLCGLKRMTKGSEFRG